MTYLYHEVLEPRVTARKHDVLVSSVKYLNYY